MDKDKNNTYPILGEPVLIGGKVYRIKEKAVIGKTYTIICAKCGKHLATTPGQAKANIEKCPQCNAIYGYNAKEVKVIRKPKPQQGNPQEVPGGEPGNEEAITEEAVSLKTYRNLGMLEWGGFLSKKRALLHIGINTIGRKDDDLPSEISFKDEYMSRQSISIDVQEDPNRSGYRFKLTVLRAKNPVIVGSSQLLVGNSTYLDYATVITLGRTVITFKENKS